MKNLVIFGGWGRNEKSYQGLINNALEGWKIYYISNPEFIPNKRFYLLGHSLGGVLALEFACHHLDMVEKLFLVDSEGIYGHESLPQVLRNFLKTHTLQGKKKAGENLKAIYRILRRPVFHFKLAHFAHHANMEEEAKAIKVPTIILWGEKDHLTPLWQGEKLHGLIKGSKLVVLKDMYHDWILLHPELFWQNIV